MNGMPDIRSQAVRLWWVKSPAFETIMEGHIPMFNKHQEEEPPTTEYKMEMVRQTGKMVVLQSMFMVPALKVLEMGNGRSCSENRSPINSPKKFGNRFVGRIQRPVVSKSNARASDAAPKVPQV